MDSFTAICIKTGRMEDGELFCKKGKSYKYILVEEELEELDYCMIRLKGENDKGYHHSMDWKFFSEYFITDNGDFIEAKEMQL